MTIPMNGDIFHFNLDSIENDNVIGHMNKIYDASSNNNESAIDPHPSPDGKHIAFVLERDLYVASTLHSSEEVHIIFSIYHR